MKRDFRKVGDLNAICEAVLEALSVITPESSMQLLTTFHDARDYYFKPYYRKPAVQNDGHQEQERHFLIRLGCECPPSEELQHLRIGG